MKVLIYSSSMIQETEKIKSLCENLVPTEEYHCLNDLTLRLRRPGLDQAIALIIAANLPELTALVEQMELLSHLRLILVVPDDEGETIDKAHLLQPRYVSFMDTGFPEVEAVLLKMINRYSAGNNGFH